MISLWKNGALDDLTSLQTGPNDDGLNNLGWAPFEIDLNAALLDMAETLAPYFDEHGQYEETAYG